MDSLLANLMLPDGAEKQPEDWTIFFLNQTPFNTIAPVLALEPSHPDFDIDGIYELDVSTDQPELLYVLNLVRTKLDKTARRYAYSLCYAGLVDKALQGGRCKGHGDMYAASLHSDLQGMYAHISTWNRVHDRSTMQPVLLMALDDYFANPSQDCLSRLFDAVNSMDISMVPVLTRHEKLIMRTSERKDVFLEKFEDYLQEVNGDSGIAIQNAQATPSTVRQTHRKSASTESQGSSDGKIPWRNGVHEQESEWGREKDLGRSDSLKATAQIRKQYSPSEASFSLDGSAVWVGNESGLDQVGPGNGNGNGNVPYRGRSSTDASSSSSQGLHGRRDDPTVAPAAANVGMNALKDTHFFPAMVDFNDHHLPIKIPLSTFPEEVGDVCTFLCMLQTY